jgi:hypothetical protein
MRDEEILIGSLMENSWLTLEQLAAACTVEPSWLLRHIEEGLFPHAESVAGVWCFPAPACGARGACGNWSATSRRYRNWRHWWPTCWKSWTMALPLVLAGSIEIDLLALVLLAVSPHLALLAQLGLSRVREFDADLEAARFTGDPAGLASALAKIERVTRSWRGWLLPGWGNPEPSWLRTHPATEERVSRLLSLAGETSDEAIGGEKVAYRPDGSPPRRRPRWYPGGYWY